jgi:hypothetical protein
MPDAPETIAASTIQVWSCGERVASVAGGRQYVFAHTTHLGARLTADGQMPSSPGVSEMQHTVTPSLSWIRLRARDAADVRHREAAGERPGHIACHRGFTVLRVCGVHSGNFGDGTACTILHKW